MPNQPKTKAHTVRVEDALWAAAAEVADLRGESLSDPIRRFLRRYVANYERVQRLTVLGNDLIVSRVPDASRPDA